MLYGYTNQYTEKYQFTPLLSLKVCLTQRCISSAETLQRNMLGVNLEIGLLLLLLLSHFSRVQLCDPTDSSPPGSAVPGILQARTLERVAISFSNAGKWKVKVKTLSHVRLLAIPWTAAHQAPLFMGFSRQEYWSGVPLPSLIYSPQGCKRVRHDLVTEQQHKLP